MNQIIDEIGSARFSSAKWLEFLSALKSGLSNHGDSDNDNAVRNCFYGQNNSSAHDLIVIHLVTAIHTG